MLAGKLLSGRSEMPQPSQPTPGNRSVLLIVLGLIAAIVVAFSGAAHCDFVYLDDPAFVFENPTVRGGLTGAGIVRAFTDTHASLWVPLTTLSFMADVSIFGMNPQAMHLENMLWHAATTALLFLALRRLTGRLWPSALVAALFGLHPVNVESVAWIVERKNVLCGFFFMLALWAWGGWARHRRAGAWWGALAAFAAALLAKPVAVTFPCVLFLLDAWPLRRWGQLPWGRLLLEKLPFFALSAATSFLATRATQLHHTVVSFESLPLAVRISNGLCSYGAYLRDLVWPEKLAVIYPHPGVVQWAPALAILGGMLVLTGLAIWQWRRRPYLLIGWLIFIGMLMPNLGLVQVGWQARADRFLYFAEIGIFIALVWLADSLLPSSRQLRVALAFVPLGALSVATFSQVSKWEDSITLFQHTIAVTKDNPMAVEHLADSFMRSGNPAMAAQTLEALLAHYPDNAENWSSLGVAHIHSGQVKLAARDYQNAVALDAQDPIAHYNLAVALVASGENAPAETAFRETLALRAEMPQALLQYGLLLEKLGRLDEAIEKVSEAHRLEPASETITTTLNRLTAAKRGA